MKTNIYLIFSKRKDSNCKYSEIVYIFSYILVIMTVKSPKMFGVSWSFTDDKKKTFSASW